MALRDGMARRLGRERVLTIGRVAVLTRPHRGRAASHYCAPCERGCVQGSYFSSLSATLPAALATGHCTVRPYSSVASVIYDDRDGRARGVRVIDTQTGDRFEVHARLACRPTRASDDQQSLRLACTRPRPGSLGPSSLAASRGVSGVER